jgi:chromosome partitioning protein
MAEAIRGKFKAATFKTEIRKNIALAEAPAMGQTIFEYSPRCNGAIDYQALTKEILKVL